MGYDVDILVYDDNKEFMGFIIEDYSLGWIREFHRFILDNAKEIKRDLYLDTIYKSDIAQKFLYYCEKNGLCGDITFKTSIEVAKRIRDNKRIAYISFSIC